jgi:hypothetical protein
MRIFSLSLFYFLVLIGTPLSLCAQSLVEDANLATDPTSGENVFTETIKIISNSKKIFILTNNNQQLGPGDFISLALDNNLAARALVAKNHQGQVGIKIVKIYSMAQWTRLRRDQEVQIIKGDDSMFGKKVEAKTEETPIQKIKNEEDLYTGDVVADEDLEIVDENKNRHIKPDNLINVFGSFRNANEVESRGGSVRATEIGGGWAFQIADNFFLEGLYSRAMFKSYPGEGQSTLLNHFTGRVKYNIKGPLYTFFMPYVGFHSFSVSSPDAGETNDSIANEEQVKAIEDLKKSGPVVGVTVLRRLVPGWFIKADLGTDIINLGFAIEF